MQNNRILRLKIPCCFWNVFLVSSLIDTYCTVLNYKHKTRATKIKNQKNQSHRCYILNHIFINCARVDANASSPIRLLNYKCIFSYRYPCSSLAISVLLVYYLVVQDIPIEVFSRNYVCVNETGIR